ncbi:MAG TPA: hypothetical protein HPQ03_08780 [Deltaproteobacteria bacterium]|nr:hypothetical protein [Deltaproteobacteria bacterium]
MRKIVIWFMVLMGVCLWERSDAGLFGDEVDLADLSQLSSEALDTLKEVEFAVFIARVKHAGAKVKENRAREDLKSAKSQLDTKSIELKAAKAKYKEVSESNAGKRASEAQAALRSAQEQHDIIQLLVKWKKKELDVQSAGADKEKAAVSIAEANRELAGAMKLVESKAPSAGRYNMDDFKKNLEKRQKEYDTAVIRGKKEMLDAKTLKAEYEKVSKP